VAADLEAVARIHRCAAQHAYGAFLPLTWFEQRDPPALRRRWEDWWNLEHQPHADALFVAEDAGTVIGFVRVEVTTEPERAFVRSLYVDPERLRGGVGRRLLRAAAAWAADPGDKPLHLTAFWDNPHRAFYDHIGGALSSEPDRHIEADSFRRCGYQWPSAAALRDRLTQHPHRPNAIPAGPPSPVPRERG
jgi:GNAT superfamily N-acetyltransferase